MTTAPARRGGFTLIELLVVISIIAILAALSAGTYFRIQAAEKVRAMNATGTKLNGHLGSKWTAILDAAADDVSKGNMPQAVLTLAGNDRDRARTIWTYFKLKNEFPTTYAEAIGDVCPNPTQLAAGDNRRGIWVWLPLPQNNANPAVLVLPARTIFTAENLTQAATPEEQSAVCLYLALSKAGNRGETAEGDGLPVTDMTIGGVSRRVFVDPWDSPIAFSRMSYVGEVNTQEYVRAGAGARDPLDPNARLVAFNTTWTTVQRDYFWTLATSNHITGTGIPVPYVSTLNWSAAVISAGPNRQWDGLFAPDSDNVVSYRLRREGNRGD